jgi:hypothetical protein
MQRTGSVHAHFARVRHSRGRRGHRTRLAAAKSRAHTVAAARDRIRCTGPLAQGPGPTDHGSPHCKSTYWTIGTVAGLDRSVRGKCPRTAKRGLRGGGVCPESRGPVRKPRLARIRRRSFRAARWQLADGESRSQVETPCEISPAGKYRSYNAVLPQLARNNRYPETVSVHPPPG